MSESDYPLISLTDAIDLWQQDLWRFNGGTRPKFWFGQKARFYKRTGVIVGMEWRSEERSYYIAGANCGWFYGLMFSVYGDSEWVHEDSLSAIAHDQT